MALPAMLSGVRASLESAAARALGTVILLSLILLVSLVAAGFFVTAFYLWLATILPAHLAALATGGLLLVISLIALLVLRSRRLRKPKPPLTARPAAPPAEALEPAAVQLLHRCLEGAGRRPDGLLAALALGIVAGLFAPRSPSSRS